MSLPVWFNALRATHAAYRNRDNIKKELGAAYSQAAEGVRTRYASYKKEFEFEKTNPRPSVRISLLKGCIWIFLPLFVVQALSGLLPEQFDSWFAYNFVWLLIAWLAGSTFAVFYLNRESKAVLREWELKRQQYLSPDC
jgi:hypothetical protein